MSDNQIRLKLSPDFCCGGGHCGPMPGYFFTCPQCGEESSCRTGYELNVGDSLSCFLCKTEFKSVEKHHDFEFNFELVVE